MKRRLLRELVEENVQLRTGERPRPVRRRRTGLGRTLRLVALIAAPAALVASSLVLSGAVLPSGARRPEAAASATAPAARAPHPASGPTAGPTSRQVAARPPAPASAAPTSGGQTPPDQATPDAAGAVPATLPARLPTRPIDASVFPLAIHRIVLDPGHGGENSGTRTPGGLEEKNLTLDIARRVKTSLERYSFDVLMTRDDDESVTLRERADFANRERADIFVSIHVNWLEGSRESGVETYYLGPSDDPFVTRLAADENVESGHSLAELRELLDRIYAGVRQDKSQGLARAIDTSLYKSLKRVNPELRDRGVKTAPFIVLVDTRMPAVLAEVAALSSAAEASMLEKPLYREYIADSLAAGIASYAESVGRSSGARSGAGQPSQSSRQESSFDE
jgi:N-acetylmuramoyl-L-alanine amidase